MKTILLPIIFLIILSIFSQKSKKFKSGVKIVKNEKVDKYKRPKSILFIFKGHTHLIIFLIKKKEYNILKINMLIFQKNRLTYLF